MSHVLLVACADRPGLVHAVTGVLYRAGANVVGNQEFVEHDSARFFMRTEFEGGGEAEALAADVRTVLPGGADVRLAPLVPRRLAVLVSREHHCLADVLVRHAFGELPGAVVAVVSNHARLGPFAARFDVPFHHVPAEGLSREDHERALGAALAPHEPDLLVLAKYMRVLTPGFVAAWEGRMVNIHHSFLPAFAGARPYHQAFARGVKVIGATAHFVTAELDAGPIIVQGVLPVDHGHSADDLVRAGRDVEQMVLARALRLVCEDRVFVSGNRTVIFD